MKIALQASPEPSKDHIKFIKQMGWMRLFYGPMLQKQVSNTMIGDTKFMQIRIYCIYI
jgi:hypothetical protein